MRKLIYFIVTFLISITAFNQNNEIGRTDLRKASRAIANLDIGFTESYTVEKSETFGVINVHGVLRIKNGVVLTADEINVWGEMYVGDLDNEISHAEIVLRGAVSSEPSYRHLMIKMGGKLVMNGERKTPFITLGQTAQIGHQSMTLSEIPEGWRVGDELAIAATYGSRKLEDEQSEKVKITSISGKVIQFNKPLKYKHHGKFSYLDSKTFAWKSVDCSDCIKIDTRGHVANLSRSIVIRGPTTEVPADRPMFSGDKHKHGWHAMIMDGANAYINGVEFRGGGQEGKAGKYPFHWHLSTNNNGDNFITNSSVNGSNWRGIVTHGSNISVMDNVVYDVVGHGYVIAEDGFETGNYYDGNIAIRVKDVPFESKSKNHFGDFWDDGHDDPHPLYDHEVPNGSSKFNQHMRAAASYWSNGTANIVINNVSGGGYQNLGFLYTSVNGPGVMRKNICYATGSETQARTKGEDRTDYRFDGGPFFFGPQDDGNKYIFEKNVFWNNRHSDGWLESAACVFQNNICIGSGVGVYAFKSTTIKNLFIGDFSDGENYSSKAGATVGMKPNTRHKTRKQFQNRKDIFVRWGVGMSVEQEGSADKFEKNQWWDYLTMVNGVKFIEVGQPLFIDYDDHNGGMIDMRGTFDGSPGIWFGKDHKPDGASCDFNADFNAWRCDMEDLVSIAVIAEIGLGKAEIGDVLLFPTEIYEPYETKYGRNQYNYLVNKGKGELVLENMEDVSTFELQMNGLKGAEFTVEINSSSNVSFYRQGLKLTEGDKPSETSYTKSGDKYLLKMVRREFVDESVTVKK